MEMHDINEEDEDVVIQVQQIQFLELHKLNFKKITFAILSVKVIYIYIYIQAYLSPFCTKTENIQRKFPKNES